METLAERADSIKASLADQDTVRGAAEAIRLAFSFVETYQKAEPSDRSLLVEEPPRPTGDSRFDALLAAIAEHVSVKLGVAIPAWVENSDRFLDIWWFVAGLRSLEADALVHSPISFARRGIFITADALTYA